MADPAYITQENLFFDGTTVPCAVLTDGPPKLAIRFDTLDELGKQRLDNLVQDNGGTLPLPDFTVTYTYKIDNGSTWWDTYGLSAVQVYPALHYPGPGSLLNVGYYDGTEWKYAYNDQPIA